MYINDDFVINFFFTNKGRYNTRYIVENHQIPYQDAIEQMKLKYNL